MADRGISDLIGTLKTTFKIAKATITAAGLTAARVIALPDKDGTVALLSDIDATAWTAWTPTLTGITLGNGTLACRYKERGKSVEAIFQLTAGSSTTIASIGGAASTFTLPKSAVSSLLTKAAIGQNSLYDSSSAISYIGVTTLESATTAGLNVGYASGSYLFQGTLFDTVPVTIATGDKITATLLYEMA